MKRKTTLALVAVCGFSLFAAPRWSQDGRKDAGRARITLYRVAPGKHLDFLKWLARQDELAKEAGIPTVTLYGHLDGDSWDYAGIGPATTPEQDRKIEELAARRGWKTGFSAALEFREYLAWHSDTFVVGPTSAAELVAQAAAGR